MKKDYQVEHFLVILFDLIENIEDPECRIALEGILRFHNR